MYIASVDVTKNAHLQVVTNDVMHFVFTYFQRNLQSAKIDNPAKESTQLANSLKRAFNKDFKIDFIDAYTQGPCDDQSFLVTLVVDTPYAQLSVADH